MAGGNQAETGPTNAGGDDPANERTQHGVADPTQLIHESETVLHDREPGPNHAPRGDKTVADLDEFKGALIELGLATGSELTAFEVDPARGVLGLAQTLVRAGRLTPYQSAAIYQQKSRGLLIGKYLILNKLGQGGMGVVFKAKQRTTGKIVALKILPPSFARDRQAVSRFKREIDAAGRLNHPNIVAALDADEDRGVHFLVMEYVEGRDLDRVVQTNGPLPVGQAIDCLIQAARGLEAAHAQGIVHRDIKPGNLMLDADGNVRVLDLGLARIIEESNPFAQTASARLTQSGMYMGTIDYMAPEQAEDSRRADHRADIYSLGCTLYYLLTGHEPFPAETLLKRLMAHQERSAPKLRSARPEAPPGLETLFQQMMAKKPAERPGTMTELITQLESCKAAAIEAQATGGPAPKSQPELKVFDEPLKRGKPVKTHADPSVADPRDPATAPASDDLRLEDLVMDVRSESPGLPLIVPAMPRRLIERRTAKAQARTDRRPPSPVVAATLGSLVFVGLIAGVLFLFPRAGRRPVEPRPEANVTETPVAETKSVAIKSSETGTISPLKKPVARQRGTPVFDGKSAKGWMLCNGRPMPQKHIQTNALNPHGSGSYLVVFEQPLGDFVLDFDYKLTKRCNSGVFLRVSDLKDPVNTGIEVAIDDTRGTGFHDPGAFYDLVRPKVQAQKPAGQWNHMTITAQGPLISVLLNGIAVSSINLDEWTVPGKRPDGSSHKFKNVAIARMARSGYLGFQDHGGDCWFKDIFLTEPAAISPGATIAVAAPLDPAPPSPEATPASEPDTARASPSPRSRKPPSPPRPQWAILGDRDRYFARNIPEDAFQKMGQLAKEGQPLKCVAFSPNGGWVILWGKNGHSWRDIPAGPAKVLDSLAREGEELRSISFTPAGGFTVLYGFNGNYSENIPDDAFKALVELTKKKVELKSVSYSQNGGCAIIYGKSGFYTRKIPDEAVKTLGALASRGEILKSVALAPDGGWVILFGPSGFRAQNVTDEALKVLRDMASKGPLVSMSFPIRPVIRLSPDDPATRENVLARMAQYNIPGLSIALVNKGRIEWARGYGVTSAAGSQAVTEETRFQAASISKPVAAVAALRLVERGKLQLDQPLNDRLVSWKVADNEFTRSRKPTLRQLLSHSAGFSVHGFEGYSPGETIPALRQVLDGKPPANSPTIKVEFVPGSKFQYSGGGYVVLQQLIIDVAGKPFRSTLQELVLDPAGMTRSGFQQPPDTELGSYAEGHTGGAPLAGGWRIHPELAAAGLWTTSSDLAHFVIAIEQAKKGTGKPILSPAMIGEMLRNQTGDFGLGVVLGGRGRSAMFFHNGQNAGFECLMVGFTETGQGAVIMANANDSFGVIQELIANLSTEYDWPG